MASTRETAALVAAARAAGAKLIAIGDSRQLASVEAGGWLGSLARRYGAHQLTEVMRQRDATERRLLAGVHARRPAAYLRHKRADGELRLYDSAPEAERALVADWRRPTGAAALRPGGDDRPRQRHARAPERGGAGGASRAGTPRRGGQDRRARVRGRRPGDREAKRPPPRCRQRDARDGAGDRREGRIAHDRDRRERTSASCRRATSPSTPSTPTRSPATACRAAQWSGRA